MGEIAEMMLDGALCGICGVYLGDGNGFMEYCRSCQPREKRQKMGDIFPRKTHTCHAEGCQKNIPERLFMCSPHWRMVSKPTQQLIYKHYRAGQEKSKDPSKEYVRVATLAKSEVAKAEVKGA